MPDSEPASNTAGRDVIVIGASMGGVEALGRLLHGLPAELPASVFVVLHTAGEDPELLARVLGGTSSLPPHITYEQAKKYAKAVLKGDPEALGIVWQSVKEGVQGILPSRS